MAPSANLELFAFLESYDIGNVFELMVGYDRSDALTYGAGVDGNHGASKKLTLVSTKAAIEATMPSGFDVLKQAVLDASGREENNESIGGRPYGFVARAATYTNAAPQRLLCFSFTVKNNMVTSGDTQYVVLSAKPAGNSFCDAWKHGTTLYEGAYALRVVNATATPKSVYGTSGKSIRDAIMTAAAGKYDWVLWGEVSQRTDSGFILNDGSGVSVIVVGANSVADGDTVSAQGSLTLDPPTLTATTITKR